MADIRNIDFFEPQVMGIINVTPDSFYASSRTEKPIAVAERAAIALATGASILDVGGYSSRQGAAEVSAEEEWRRVDVGIGAIRSVSTDVAISVDTFRGSVARRAVEKYGDLIINDISAAEIDGSILDVVAQADLPYVAMHMRGKPESMQSMTRYDDIVTDVVDYFKHKVDEFASRGVRRIILDPGFGFAKTLDQNYELLASLEKLCALGYPVLSGVSRKSMIYKLLGVTPADSLTGTTVLNWESLSKGASILRVHDVAEAMQVVRIFNKYMCR